MSIAVATDGLILDWRPRVNARWHGDAILLSAIQYWNRVLDHVDDWRIGGIPQDDPLMAVWARMNDLHWAYVLYMLEALVKEAYFRRLIRSKKIEPRSFPGFGEGKWICPPFVIPEQYRIGSYLYGNRVYYESALNGWDDVWTRRNPPAWMNIDLSYPRLFHKPRDKFILPDAVLLNEKTRSQIWKYKGRHLVCDCDEASVICDGPHWLMMANGRTG